MSDSEPSSAAVEEGLRRFIEDAAARLEGALTARSEARLELLSADPSVRRLSEAINQLLQAARQLEARAEAIAQDRDALEAELLQLQTRLGEEIIERERSQQEVNRQRSLLRSLVDSFVSHHEDLPAQ
jgi:predicted transcriptional regulator